MTARMSRLVTKPSPVERVHVLDWLPSMPGRMPAMSRARRLDEHDELSFGAYCSILLRGIASNGNEPPSVQPPLAVVVIVVVDGNRRDPRIQTTSQNDPKSK